MKKVVVLLVGMLCAVLTSQGAYLYWQVSQADMGSSYVEGNKYVGQVFAYQTSAGTSSAIAIDMGDAPATGSYKIDVANYGDGYSFYVEVFNYSSSGVGSSVKKLGGDQGAQTYTQLLSNGAIIEGTDLKVAMTQVWHGGSNYSPAPEPTSGLLMMVGLALLGLKRRKV